MEEDEDRIFESLQNTQTEGLYEDMKVQAYLQLKYKKTGHTAYNDSYYIGKIMRLLWERTM